MATAEASMALGLLILAVTLEQRSPVLGAWPQISLSASCSQMSAAVANDSGRTEHESKMHLAHLPWQGQGCDWECHTAERERMSSVRGPRQPQSPRAEAAVNQFSQECSKMEQPHRGAAIQPEWQEQRASDGTGRRGGSLVGFLGSS